MLPSEQESFVSASLKRKSRTHNDVDSLIKIDDLALIIYDGHSTDAELREHVHHIEDRRLHRCRRDWVVRPVGSGILHVRPYAEFLDASGEILGNVSTLGSVSGKHN